MNSLNFFLGANSDKGFVSYFNELQDFSDFLQLFILKGGPGSGKSSLMKKIYKHAQNLGHSVEAINCASDPNSLDAFIDYTQGIAMADGTAPHSFDPFLPGVKEHIIYTGEYWDTSLLLKNKEEIYKLNEEIADCHKSATAYIKAAASLIKENMDIARKHINKKELMEFGEMLASLFAKGSSAREKKRLLSAVTCGRVEFFESTLSSLADKIYVLDDPWGASSDMLLSSLRTKALSNNLKIITCPCSVIPDRLEHIIIPSEKTAISVKNSFHGTQKSFAETGGFYHPFDESALKERQQSAHSLINKATECVNKAKSLHDDLERHYVNAMDFSHLETIAEKLKKQLYL
ncbi:MAG: hypothetical protein IKA17_04295 [Clostridia bacterium]|nr:hypothetical protein [Clostridia bacterium]